MDVSVNPVSLRQGRPTCGDVNQSEQSHPGVSAHRPLLRLTVGLTAVIHEARLVSLRPCVDDSVLTQRQTVSLSSSREMRLFLTRLKGHHGQCLLNTFHSPHAGSSNKKNLCVRSSILLWFLVFTSPKRNYCPTLTDAC